MQCQNRIKYTPTDPLLCGRRFASEQTELDDEDEAVSDPKSTTHEVHNPMSVSV